MTYHVQFLLLVLTGWVNRQQQDVIDYLQEENRVLRAGLRGKRLRLSDDDRRRCRRYPTKFNSGRDIPRAFPTCVSMLRFDCSIKLRVAQRRVACRMQDLPRGGNKREPAYDTCSLIGQTGPATNSGIRCMRQQRSLSDDQVDVFTQSSSIECFS